MRFCGIDLHSNNSVVVVTDETDKVLVSRRCPNDLSKILALLAPHRGELSGVVVESTYNWYWLVDGLMAEGYDVRLANTVAMKRYDGLKHSDDETPLLLFTPAQMLVIATPDAFKARKMIEIARTLNPRIHIVVRSHSEDEADLLRREHAVEVRVGERELADSMVRHVGEHIEIQMRAKEAARETAPSRS